MVFNNAGNNSRLLVDMDTSESEHSDLDATYDDDDTEWEATEKRIARKRNSKTDGRMGAFSHPIEVSDSESSKTEASDERMTTVTQKTASGLCCTCSKSSLCKTMRCECRAGRGSCGVSCNCVSSKCSNRDGTLTNALDYLSNSELGDCNDESDRSQNLASEGAKLLQSALAEKPVEANEGNEPTRKPLSDIGNTVVQYFLTFLMNGFWVVCRNFRFYKILKIS